VIGAAPGDAVPRLRVGILSDVHVDIYWKADLYEKALRLFDSRKVDAVVIAGDFTCLGTIREFEMSVKSWYKVFPGDRRSDGQPVTRLFVTGNHDIDIPGKGLFYDNRQAFWKKAYGEDYEFLSVKTVKGYPFVLRHWPRTVNGVRNDGGEDLAKILSTLRCSDRPFFYVQHDSIAETTSATWLAGVGGRWDFGQERGGIRRVLEKYPNCLALTGHCHHTLTDERSIWQGAFTAVNCSCSCGYAFSVPGRENGFDCSSFNREERLTMPSFDNRSVHQGLVMEVFDDRITLERLDVKDDVSLGEDWVVPLFAGGRTVPTDGSVPVYDFRARFERSLRPVFRKDAKVVVRRVVDGRRRDAGGSGSEGPVEQVHVTFPSIRTCDGSPVRGYDFLVRCETRTGDMVRTIDERRVFSPGFMQCEAKDAGTCLCAFPDDRIPKRQTVRFTVVPFNSWGREGTGLVTEWLYV